MAYKFGKICKVALGSATVVGMGEWIMNGISVADIDVTAFGDTWMKTDDGLKDGGTVTFSGWWDVADVTGAEALRYHQAAGTNLTTLRLYIDNTSYFTPCQTTGYWSPTTTTGADTVLSYVRIRSCTITDNKNDVVRINFEAKVDGVLVLI